MAITKRYGLCDPMVTIKPKDGNIEFNFTSDCFDNETGGCSVKDEMLTDKKFNVGDSFYIRTYMYVVLKMIDIDEEPHLEIMKVNDSSVFTIPTSHVVNHVDFLMGYSFDIDKFKREYKCDWIGGDKVKFKASNIEKIYVNEQKETVTVKLKDGRSGTAKCTEGDNFDQETGIIRAYILAHHESKVDFHKEWKRAMKKVVVQNKKAKSRVGKGEQKFFENIGEKKDN